MIWWILILAVLVILSYLSQVGILFSLQVRFPFLIGSFLTLLILVCLGAVLFRIMKKTRKGEKENYLKKIQELEQEVKRLRAK